MKTAKNNDIECSIIDVREGFVHLCLSGANVRDVLQNEEGVHSWHRPPEKKGRATYSINRCYFR
jgi:hypothetical protein